MYSPGPLHEIRQDIVDNLANLPLQTGDIFYRSGNAKGPLGLPFSKIVELLSWSDYSHAAIVLKQGDEYFMLELNDRGTLKQRLIEWLDDCYDHHFLVHRYNNMTEELRKEIESNLRWFWHNNPEYDFSFESSAQFYCTESVITVYKMAGIEIAESYFIKDCISKPAYWCLVCANYVYRLLTGMKLPLDQKLYFVGNEERGMLASDKTTCIFSQDF